MAAMKLTQRCPGSSEIDSALSWQIWDWLSAVQAALRLSQCCPGQPCVFKYCKYIHESAKGVQIHVLWVSTHDVIKCLKKTYNTCDNSALKDLDSTRESHELITIYFWHREKLDDVTSASHSEDEIKVKCFKN